MSQLQRGGHGAAEGCPWELHTPNWVTRFAIHGAVAVPATLSRAAALQGHCHSTLLLLLLPWLCPVHFPGGSTTTEPLQEEGKDSACRTQHTQSPVLLPQCCMQSPQLPALVTDPGAPARARNRNQQGPEPDLWLQPLPKAWLTPRTSTTRFQREHLLPGCWSRPAVPPH